ncbi:hypothetical protein BQ8482_60024 [Mesorhizobium delmotii]|uniref:Uncharacterized protein n=1 Tax=Mesorhizobium delmotii TaxID=1631247 RepID=A0A2P9AV17_9HYPH|nr:hypothetical protein BQ8482_60024 [Mesorhizobium delmotii]
MRSWLVGIEFSRFRRYSKIGFLSSGIAGSGYSAPLRRLGKTFSAISSPFFGPHSPRRRRRALQCGRQPQRRFAPVSPTGMALDVAFCNNKWITPLPILHDGFTRSSHGLAKDDANEQSSQIRLGLGCGTGPLHCHRFRRNHAHILEGPAPGEPARCRKCRIADGRGKNA